LFVIKPAQHIAKGPNLLSKVNGCGSLSDITPIPILQLVLSEPS